MNLHDKITPAVAKRAAKLPAYLRSPYCQDFGSTSGKSSERLKDLKGVSALDNNIGQMPTLEAIKGYTAWLDDGMITRKKYV